jgi:F-type H+-transporting ATPase subunit epsilon
MPSLHVKMVTAERQLADEQADMVIAPGGAGEIGILPRHIPLITTLKPGELRIRKADEEQLFAVGGGVLEVRNIEGGSEVIVLADTAERAEDLDLERANAARQKAEQHLTDKSEAVDAVAAQAALLRAIARIRVAERHRSRPANR